MDISKSFVIDENLLNIFILFLIKHNIRSNYYAFRIIEKLLDITDLLLYGDSIKKNYSKYLRINFKYTLDCDNRSDIFNNIINDKKIILFGPVKMFVLIVLFNDEYLRFSNRTSKKIRRFFSMSKVSYRNTNVNI